MDQTEKKQFLVKTGLKVGARKANCYRVHHHCEGPVAIRNIAEATCKRGRGRSWGFGPENCITKVLDS